MTASRQGRLAAITSLNTAQFQTEFFHRHTFWQNP